MNEYAFYVGNRRNTHGNYFIAKRNYDDFIPRWFFMSLLYCFRWVKLHYILEILHLATNVCALWMAKQTPTTTTAAARKTTVGINFKVRFAQINEMEAVSGSICARENWNDGNVYLQAAKWAFGEAGMTIAFRGMWLCSMRGCKASATRIPWTTNFSILTCERTKIR